MSARICHMSSVHGPKDVRIFHKECVSLAAHGFEVILVVPGTSDHTDQGVKIIGVPIPSSRSARISRTLPRILKIALSVDASLYHFHDPELFLVGLILKAKGKRVVFDSHEDLPRQIMTKPWIYSRLRAPVAGVAESVENRCARCIDGVVAATPVIAKRFSELGVRSAVVNNYPIPTEWDGAAVDWGRKKRQVVYAGGITEIRGAREMVAAIRQTDARLVLAGTVEASLVSELEEAQRLGAVELAGFLDRASVVRCFSESRVGLCVLWPTSNYLESSPVKLFEYMAAGLPVVASNFPHWRALVNQEEVGIFVNPRDPDQIAGAIEYLLDHPEEAEAMGRRGRELVVKHFNWQIEERALIELYQRLLT